LRKPTTKSSKAFIVLPYRELDNKIRNLHKENAHNAEFGLFETEQQVSLNSITEQGLIDKETQLSAAVDTTDDQILES
jgi:hypothetical protein